MAVHRGLLETYVLNPNMITGWIDEHIWNTTYEKENNMLFVKCKSCGQEFAYNPYYCSGVEAKKYLYENWRTKKGM